MSSFEEKYLKALRSIEEILKANRQIKEQLDALRAMRQAEIDSCTDIQNEEFRKAYDALLRDKNAVAIRNQALELDNERLKYALAELEQQLAAALKPTAPAPDASGKPESREAELRRSIQNLEEHQATLQRNWRRLEERNGELEGRLLASEKAWRAKMEAKELEVVEVKARARQELGEQVSALRKENAALRLVSSEATARLDNCQQGALFGQQLQTLEWEGDLLRELSAVRSSLEPLQQQVSELREADFFQQERAARERAALQARVLELEAEGQRRSEVERALEERVVAGEEARRASATLAEQVRRLEEEKQLLSGRVVVMEAREVVLRSRGGEELEERVLEFESRIELLLANKEGLRDLREVGLHQLIALKAYILELDSRLKELLLSNGYLLKKYKSYKEKYQASLKEQKQYGLTINTLRTKIMGYDQLVLKLQAELEAALRAEPVRQPKEADGGQEDLFRRKYELLLEKLELQEKYKTQELETVRLNYESRIVELTIKAEESKSLRETIELYRARNEELQGQLARRESEIIESKVLTQSKVVNEQGQPRQSRDIMALHATIKAHDDTIFRLQSELRSKEETHRRTVRKLEKELEDAREQQARELARKELDFSLTLDQEVKKYRLRVAELEHAQQYAPTAREGDDEEQLRSLQRQLETAESAREEEIFNRRRLEKQVLDLTNDYQELQRSSNELQLKLGQFRTLQRDYEDLKRRTGAKEASSGHWDYQLQSKDAIIKKLNIELQELKQAAAKVHPVPASQKNEVHYLKQEIEELRQTIARQSRESPSIAAAIDGSRARLSGELEAALQEKEALVGRLRRDLALKENRLLEFEEEAGKLTEEIRRFKRELSEIDRLRHETTRLEAALLEKERALQQLRSEGASYDVELDRIRQELLFVKENYQRLSYESLEKSDQIARLTLEAAAAGSRTSALLEGRHAEELADRDRKNARLASDLSTLRAALATAEEDLRYHEENSRRASSDLLRLREECGQVREENEDLRGQLSSINQEILQMRSAVEAYRGQTLERREHEEENYLIKTEFFALKSDISHLHEEVFSKESAIARMTNQIALLKAHNAELQEEASTGSQQNTKIAFEYSMLRDQHMEVTAAIEERDDAFQRISLEVATLRREKRELSEDLQYMSSNFGTLSQELAKTKTNLAFYEEEIEAKGKENARLVSEAQALRAEVASLHEAVSEKQAENNKIRQEMLAARFEASERDYEEKLRADRQIYAHRAKIAALERDLEEKDHELRRIEKMSRPESATYDFEVQELRMELEKSQRELLAARSEIQRCREEQSILEGSMSSLRRAVAEREEQLRSEREETERWKIQLNTKQGKAKEEAWRAREEAGRAREEIERLKAELLSQRLTITRSKQFQLQLSAAQEQLGAKNVQILQLRLAQQELLRVHQQFDERTSQIHESVARQHMQAIAHLQASCQEYDIQAKHYQSQLLQRQHKIQQTQHKIQQYEHKIQQHNLRFQQYEHKIQQYSQYGHKLLQYQRRIQECEHIIHNYEYRVQNYEHRVQQYEHRIVFLSQQSQQFTRREHNYEASFEELRMKHSQETSQLRSQLREASMAVVGSSHSVGVSPPEEQLLIHPYLEEIERLNSIIQQLEEDLSAFKLKLLAMVGHENRIEQNLSAMVRIFNEVVSVRHSIGAREAEIGEVRRSFLQKADSESGRSSRALAHSGHRLASSQEIAPRASLQGSSVQQQEQGRGGLISIKIGSSGQFGPHQPLPPSPQQAFVQPVQPIRSVQHLPFPFPGQLSIQGTFLGQIGSGPARQ